MAIKENAGKMGTQQNNNDQQENIRWETQTPSL